VGRRAVLSFPGDHRLLVPALQTLSDAVWVDSRPVIVLLTIHGVGYQRAPTSIAASDGYADALHESLRSHLRGVLGDDPFRTTVGGRGPVYVQSNFPPLSNATEPGVRRVGNWTASGAIDSSEAPLATAGSRVAHVAFVYSGLEEHEGDTPALLGVDVPVVSGISEGAARSGIARMALSDLEALRVGGATAGPPSPSLRPRADTSMHRGIVDRLLSRPATAGIGMLRTVEDDVAAYVLRNEHRERVRSFVRDATSRLLARQDVDGVVVNCHSNGTVIGFDLCAALSPPSARRVCALITSGSPLRKYVDLFDWGRDVGNLRLMTGTWTNFWDLSDPIADPLNPPPGWKRGQSVPLGSQAFFIVRDPETGGEAAMAITDVLVDNVRDSAGGGLRAHNYWDNGAFSAHAARILTATLESRSAPGAA
jgi:hypothetical protein